MTQKEQKQTAEFKTKWMLVYKEFDGTEIYVNRITPYVFCRPSCGDWEVWRCDPSTGWRVDSVLCTYEHMMQNF